MIIIYLFLKGCIFWFMGSLGFSVAACHIWQGDRASGLIIKLVTLAKKTFTSASGSVKLSSSRKIFLIFFGKQGEYNCSSLPPGFARRSTPFYETVRSLVIELMLEIHGFSGNRHGDGVNNHTTKKSLRHAGAFQSNRLFTGGDAGRDACRHSVIIESFQLVHQVHLQRRIFMIRRLAGSHRRQQVAVLVDPVTRHPRHCRPFEIHSQRFRLGITHT